MKNNWYGIDICKKDCDDFKKMLKENNIIFETSENHKYNHFEIYISEKDCALVNYYVDEFFMKHKTIKFEKCTPEEAKDEGYPTFNQCNHYIADMSHLDSKTKDWMNTISIKLPNGNFVTLCIMQTCSSETCIDVKFYGEKLKDHKVLCFGGEGEDTHVDNKGLYALVAHSNE